MRRTVFVGALIPALVVLAAAGGLSRQTEKAPPSGPYLWQKPPGMTPEIFAPGVVSREGIQMKLTMTIDGSEILCTERDQATKAASFIIRRRAGDSWGEPLVLPYSREYMDIEPSLSIDGQKILFVSNRPVSGQGESEKMPDIWMAEKSGDHWGNPVRLGPPVLTDDPDDIEAHPAFFPDGGIYFMRQNGKTRRLFQAARRDGEGFDAPVPLPLKEDLLAGQFSGPYFSPDGRILIMHSRKEGGFGNWDLYVAFKDESGGWSKLKNLGPAVNTDKPESSPTFSPDGQFIFFTRETDIYWVSAKVIEVLKPKEAERAAIRQAAFDYIEGASSAVSSDREAEKQKIAEVVSSVIGWAKDKNLNLFYGSIANDEDYISVTPGKRVVKRFEDVKQNVPFWMSPDFKYVRHELKDLEITFARCGTVAWFFCVLDDINTYKGEPANWENARWTGVVEKRDGRWVVVSQHFSFAGDK